MRRWQLKRLWTRLEQLSTMELGREELLMKLGAARGQSRKAWRLVVIEVATDSPTFSHRLDRKKLRQARRREGPIFGAPTPACAGAGSRRGRPSQAVEPLSAAGYGGRAAPGLTPRSVLEKFAAMQMIDVHLPTTDGRELLLTRYTQPEPELNLLLKKLKLDLPAQPPPKITASALPKPTPL